MEVCGFLPPSDTELIAGIDKLCNDLKDMTGASKFNILVSDLQFAKIKVLIDIYENITKNISFPLCNLGFDNEICNCFLGENEVTFISISDVKSNMIYVIPILGDETNDSETEKL